MRRFSLGVALLLLWPAVAQAHFLWLAPVADEGGRKVRVYFGEAAEPDDPDLLDKVADAEVWTLGGRGEPKALKLVRNGDALEASLNEPATTILRHSYGVVAKGGEPFLLKYYAKAYPFVLPGTWRTVRDVERLPLEVTPELDGNSVVLTAYWNGAALAGATVTVTGPGVKGKLEGTTDAAGRFRADLAQGGVFSVRAKHTEATPGKSGDQEYKSVRHYSTLTLNLAPSRLAPVAAELPKLPKGTTSFGGAVIGDSLFVYGGNYGSAHEYVRDDQSGDLWTLDLRKPGKWQAGPGGPRLQGLAMIAHQGALYRIGGFSATNKSGEEQDLHSQTDFARWTPGAAEWESLPPLPEARSSHDAAVVGDTLYVVGGWNMQGRGTTAKWHDQALALDLTANKLEWKPVAPPPFRRRALALAEWRGKLYCIGGMQEKGGPTTAVAVYEPARDAWTEGPALVGIGMEGFGSSAFASQGTLYVTTVSGSIQRLADDGSSWEFVGQLRRPRFFHRLLPWQADRLVVVGGADMTEGKTEALELLNVSTKSASSQ